MLNEDNIAYWKYTGPQRLDKAIHSLEGIIRGIAADQRVSSRELSLLTGWLGDHSEFADRHPFNEIVPLLRTILADGIVDEEEVADLLWLCDRVSTNNGFFSAVTSDMQRLHGLLGGIAADGVITEDELITLRAWLDEHASLRTCWPYDEVDSLILSVLNDGMIEKQEHDDLLQFFSEFVQHPGHRAIDLSSQNDSVLMKGVCAVCPKIEFADRRFCFTGSSERYSREQFADEIVQRGGVFCKSLVQSTDYLVVGADGNPCWAFACYGRKVEKAIVYRRKGCNIVLVHEYDLWDAMADSYAS